MEIHNLYPCANTFCSKKVCQTSSTIYGTSRFSKFCRGNTCKHLEILEYVVSCFTCCQLWLCFQLKTTVCLSLEESVSSREEALSLEVPGNALCFVCPIRDWRLLGFACRSLLSSPLPVFISPESILTCNAFVLLRFCPTAPQCCG